MKQKIILYIVVILGGFHCSMAQENLKRADNFFKKAYYVDAIPLYEAALVKNKSSQLIQNLADCYYHTFDMKSAARWYSYLVSNYGENLSEDYYFKLNQSLKAIGNYDEAHDILRTFYAATGASDKVKELEESAVYLENVAALGNRFILENLALNTTASEFGAMEIRSELWYTAAHKTAKTRTYRWNNQKYLDIYTHPLGKLMLGDSISSELGSSINTKMHEGAFALTTDQNTIYFTRNNYLKGKRKTDANKVSNLKIYKAELIDGQWTNITELPFNSDDFSNAHPALNSDGSKLYFASDRPGGYGSFDLYEVSIHANGTYGAPINLGATINTDKKEQFPFIDTDNTLFFSSNGHPGFGLLDVFMAKHHNGSFENPDNLGFPVNSGYDDFSYIVTKEKEGYFASNRPTGKGSDDIYAFKETKGLLIEDCLQYIAGVITDRSTLKPLSEVSITVVDQNDKDHYKVKTGNDGTFNFPVDCKKSYTVIAVKDGYEDNSKLVVTSKERNTVQDASMDLYSHFEKEKAAQLALAEKQQAEIARVEREKLQAERIAAKKLEEEKIKAKKLAELRMAEKAKAKAQKAKKIAQIIASDNAIKKDKERTIIETEEIHFDYSLWYLRRESRERLAVVIETMKANPGMIIEIGTHTDIRGNAGYNKELSQKRADSAKEYLVKNGIASDRIVSKGYGESRPIVVCPTEADCTEEDHEWNRRCEFVVLSWDYEPVENSKKQH